ncbi:MAG: LodA/GoxA family CTQ-dependent oxidase [Hellea sp.]
MTNILLNIASIKVSPGIGMGRVGNSDEYFLGPETPGVTPVPLDGNYKDSGGALRRQAQRFRVFGYDGNGKYVDEITAGSSVNGQVVDLAWTVHVTNMKAANYAFQGKYNFSPSDLRNSTIQPETSPELRTDLIIDPGPIAISGPSQGPVDLLDPSGTGSTIFDISGSHTLSPRLKYDPPQSSTDPIPVTYTPATVSLGELHTDADGRLIFVGGKGISESCTTPKVLLSKVVNDDADEPNPEYNGNSYFNNPGWYDDTCGGSVDVEIFASGTTTSPLFSTINNSASRAWVAVAPPHYSPATYNVVSLLDLQLDIFPQVDPYTGKGPFFYAQAATPGETTIPLAVSTTGAPNDFNFYSVNNPGNDYAPDICTFKNNAYLAVGGVNDIYLGEVIQDDPSQTSFTTIGFPASTYIASAPSMAVLNDQLYVAIIDQASLELIIAKGVPGSFDISNITPATAQNVIIVDGRTAPAIQAFNGDLYSAICSPTGKLYIGKAVDGLVENFQFLELTLPSDEVPLSTGNVSLTYFAGKLYLGFITTEGQAYLGSASDGLSFTNAADNTPSFINIGAVLNGNVDYGALSLTAFNNEIYFAYNGQLGTSKDGVNFSFAAVDGAIGSPAVTANVSVNFYRDIYPTLKTVTDYAWTNERAFHGHRPGKIAGFLRPDYLQDLSNPVYSSTTYSRPFVFKFIRPPAQATYVQSGDDLIEVSIPAPPLAAPKGQDSLGHVTGIFAGVGVQQREELMPRLFGNGGSVSENQTNGTNHPNQWLPLTNHQLEKFQKWVNGDFESGNATDVQYQDLLLPDKLDFAALQPTVGGGFHPGIELTYLMHYQDYFSGAFRFNQATVPGSIAGYMSVPWQGDFWSCNISWWPALRPDIVVQSDDSTVPPTLTYDNWFRGNEIPPESDSLADYEGGYDIMLKSWPDFGLVTPVLDVNGLPKLDQGQPVYQETERSNTLDLPSNLENINSAFSPTGLILNNHNGAFTVEAPIDGSVNQQWALVKSSSESGYLFIEYVATGEVLTVDFSTGDLSLAAKETLEESSQHWTYIASDTPNHPEGQPGQFMLKSQLNRKCLSVDVNGNVAAQSGGEILWSLQAAV